MRFQSNAWPARLVEAEILAGEEVIPASRAPWVALCPSSLGQAGGEEVASTRFCKELSACCVAVVLRMFFSRWGAQATCLEAWLLQPRSGWPWQKWGVVAPRAPSPQSGLPQALIHVGAGQPAWPQQPFVHR
jgi:hypothetical protein